MEDIRLSAVAYQVDGLWIVQGIEYDIRARAYAREEVVQALVQAVHERLALNTHLGRKALEGVTAAPQQFVEMYKRAAKARHARPAHDASGPVDVVFA